MQSQTIEFEGSGGVRLIADTWGDPKADPILFMHGGGQTRHSWGGAAMLLASKGWRTLSIDLRGHGDSGWSPKGEYEAEHFCSGYKLCIVATGPDGRLGRRFAWWSHRDLCGGQRCARPLQGACPG